VPPFFPGGAFFATLSRMSNPPAPARLVRYLADGEARYGLERGDHLERLSDAPWRGGRPDGRRDAPDSPRLAPCEPSKIVCIGLNYVEHVRESLTVAPGTAGPPAEPLFFFKPPSAVIGPGAAIVRPAGIERLDPEGEMALVIGRRARHVAERDALAHVAGVTCFNDVSARDWQKQDGQWSRAKGSDTFAPIGPCVVLGLDPRDLGLETRVNGELRQRARTRELHFGPAHLVSFVSRHVTLEPGDVIATGTPAGIAPIVPGDVVEVTVEGVGTLTNPVEQATAAPA
jgi:2-keto-4-pentenoate hydratase/2-oxohepta-3-ene-1,7-dioic acid hydratase in catechol pathway